MWEPGPGTTIALLLLPHVWVFFTRRANRTIQVDRMPDAIESSRRISMAHLALYEAVEDGSDSKVGRTESLRSGLNSKWAATRAAMYRIHEPAEPTIHVLRHWDGNWNP
jgi:hypothetical protein